MVADELEQLRAAHPDRRIELTTSPDNRGRWDGARLQQLLRNLVSNAIKYGSPDKPVRVALRGEQADLFLEVTNSGPTIDPSDVRTIFDPLERGAAHRESDDAAAIREAGSGWDSSSCAKLPRRMVVTSRCVPSGERPPLPCACRATEGGASTWVARVVAVKEVSRGVWDE